MRAARILLVAVAVAFAVAALLTPAAGAAPAV